MAVKKALIKKDLTEKFSQYKGKNKDVGGILLNIILTLFIAGVFIIGVSFIAKTYINVKIGFISNKLERVYEILTLFFALQVVLLAISGVSKLNKNLIEVSNISLLAMPITPFQIYISKMLSVYLKLFLSSIIMTIPMFVMLVVWSLLPWQSILIAGLFSLLLPTISLFLSSIFTVPYFYIKKWLNKHFILQLILYSLIVIGLFLVYSVFLNLIKSLLETGQIQFLLNEKNIHTIQNVCEYLIPFKFFASVFVSKNILISCLIILGSVVISTLICFLISRGIFAMVRQNRIGNKVNFVAKGLIFKPDKPIKRRKQIKSLLAKEFISVLRTPSYAFNYFAIVISLPLMVVICVGLMDSIITKLTLFDCRFEIALCSVSVFSILLNTFSANNISRDGKFYNLLKTFPINPKTVIFSKILFCSIVSIFAILISSLTLFFTNSITMYNMLAIFGISSLLNVGVICLATRKDLNTANKSENNENKTSTNFLIFWGLIFSIIITIGSIVLSIQFQAMFDITTAKILTSTVLFGVSLIIFIISIIYLFVKLDSKYKEVTL